MGFDQLYKSLCSFCFKSFFPLCYSWQTTLLSLLIVIVYGASSATNPCTCITCMPLSVEFGSHIPSTCSLTAAIPGSFQSHHRSSVANDNEMLLNTLVVSSEHFM